ncbi:MAG: hypothetical protein IKH30_01645 [Clostridia bacterium]|nr:hypothetical protein [Clostridia bacterium]MBR4537257.1 hypothetical protein [Clostridia bacterium]MBR4540512.1 hypothetical protein [Clostridia bacterium]
MAKEMEAYDPWKDMRPVYVPKRTRTEQDTLEVGVNDRTFFIPKDQSVDVPLPVYEVVQERLRMEKAFEQNMKKNENLSPRTQG